MTPDEFCDYRFLVNTEGRSWSSRLTLILNCDSVPIIHDMRWMAHYYHLLVPEVNCVEVLRNFSDLPEKVSVLLEDNDRAQQIADNARTTFRERYTTPAATACYWGRLLRGWASVAFKPNVYEDTKLDNSTDFKLRGISFDDFMNREDPSKDYVEENV